MATSGGWDQRWCFPVVERCPNGNLCYTNNGVCTASGCKCRSNLTHGSDCSQSRPVRSTDTMNEDDFGSGTCEKSHLVCHNGGYCVNEKHCQCLSGWSGVTCTDREQSEIKRWLKTDRRVRSLLAEKCPGFKDLVCHSTTCPAIGTAPVCQCPGHMKGKDCSGSKLILLIQSSSTISLR